VFDEVVLFLDCCLDMIVRFTPPAPHFREIIAPDLQRSCRFFASSPTHSRERPLPPNRLVLSVFTAALLDGLRGKAWPQPRRADAVRLTGGRLLPGSTPRARGSERCLLRLQRTSAQLA
jgi:uncharacterized caspase-like protein